MSTNSHLVELSEKHKSLERRISEEINRPSCDTAALSRLKREKLKIKDEIVKLERRTRH